MLIRNLLVLRSRSSGEGCTLKVSRESRASNLRTVVQYDPAKTSLKQQVNTRHSASPSEQIKSLQHTLAVVRVVHACWHNVVLRALKVINAIVRLRARQKR